MQETRRDEICGGHFSVVVCFLTLILQCPQRYCKLLASIPNNLQLPYLVDLNINGQHFIEFFRKLCDKEIPFDMKGRDIDRAVGERSWENG